MADFVKIFSNKVGGFVKAVRTSKKLNKESNGTITLMAADAADARNVVIVVKVTETFANGTGGQPTFKLGETSTTDKYAATSVFTDAAKGAIFTFAGTLTATKALLVTAVAATGTGAGAISIEALVLPATA